MIHRSRDSMKWCSSKDHLVFANTSEVVPTLTEVDPPTNPQKIGTTLLLI